MNVNLEMTFAMSEMVPNRDAEFEDIIVFNASRDHIVRRNISWLLEENIEVEFYESPDYYKLLAYIRDNWGLVGEGAERAIEMCEDDLTKRLRADG